jgi:C_GCAxxG_C_C family probable redox protein
MNPGLSRSIVRNIDLPKTRRQARPPLPGEIIIRSMNRPLSVLVDSGYGEERDLNCAETILWGANLAYDLGLGRNALRLASGFGGGMGIEATCGALTGAVMVLGRLYTRDRSHESPQVKELCERFLRSYRGRMGSIDCAPLKEKYRTEQLKCRAVVREAALLLEELIAEQDGKEPRQPRE